MVARDFEMALERHRAGGLGLAAHRGGRGERPDPHPGRAHGPERPRAAARGRHARARHVAGDLLLRVRRAARPVRARLRARGRGLRSQPWPRPSARERSSSSASTRSPTAETASRGSTDSSSSFAAGLPGDLVRARATKVKRGFAEATRTALLEPGPDRVEAPCRALRHLRRLPLPGLRLRAPARGEGATRSATRSSGSAASPSRRSSRSCPAALAVYGYRNKLEYSFAAGAGRRSRPRLPPGGPLGRGLHVDECLLTTRPRQRDPRRGQGVGARGGARAVRPGDADRLPAPPRRPRGRATPARCSSCS